MFQISLFLWWVTEQAIPALRIGKSPLNFKRQIFVLLFSATAAAILSSCCFSVLRVVFYLPVSCYLGVQCPQREAFFSTQYFPLHLLPSSTPRLRTCWVSVRPGQPSIAPSLRDSWPIAPSADTGWRRKWQPTPVLLLGKSHGRRSLVGYSPWGC